MKKTLAMLLAVLVALSMFSVAAFAEDSVATEAGKVTVIFKVEADAKDYKTIIFDVTGNDSITSLVPENPTKASDGKYDYTFKGWVIEGDESGNIYYKDSIPTPTAEDAGKTITYIAAFKTEPVKKTQTFWNFIESIFERINLIFRYFENIFAGIGE